MNANRIQAELDWLRKHPEFEERPATLLEFLGPDYLGIESRVRASIKKELSVIMGDKVSAERPTVYQLAMITGGIGIGKTTVASIVLPYLAHWVLCLRDPQGFFGLLPGSRIAFMQMSTSEGQAAEVVFGDIKARIQHSPWFANKYPYDTKFSKQIRFPKDVWVIPGDSAETTFEGYNILGGILDEADSHKVTKNKDYADVGYTTIQSRIESRFEDKGFLLVIGQMKKGNGFAAKKYREFCNRDDAYAVRMSIWESMGWDHYRDEDGNVASFHYDTKRKMIVPAGVAALTGSEQIIEIPEVFRKSFVNDPEKALRDLAGIPPAVGDPFISLTYKIDEARDRWLKRHFPEGVYDENLGNYSPIDAQGRPAPWFRNPTTSIKRVGHLDLAYCVDSETEVLTQRGWLRHDEVQVGDMALTLDDETHLSRWEPVLDVNRFEGSGQMLSIEGMSHSSLTTANHRWLVDERIWVKETRRCVGNHPAVVTSKELSGRHSIVSAAACEDFPDETKFSDDFVELVAWFWTEGCIGRLRDGSRSSNIEIYQSSSVNPQHCERIRKCLNKVFGPPTEKFPRGGRATDGVPRWREYMNGDKVCWYLSSDAGRMLIEQAPNRVVRQDFILSLTESQVRLFAEVSIWADGNSANEIAQKNPDALDVMQLVWVLLGRATNKYEMASGMTMLGSSEKRTRLKFKKSIAEWIDYEGIVWCPTTPSGSWLARRNGKTYFTGNSGDGDALGFALGHVREVVEIDGEKKPYIVIDLLYRLQAPKGDEIFLGDVRRFIYSLRDDYKFRMNKITMDGFQSTDTRQQLKKRRIPTDLVSIDRDVLPYHDLREALYEERIEFPPYMVKYHRGDTKEVEILVKELTELINEGDKVDHPPDGSKDVADAVAGVVTELMGDRRYHKGVTRIDNYQEGDSASVGHQPLGQPALSHPAFRGGQGIPAAPVPPVTVTGPFR